MGRAARINKARNAFESPCGSTRTDAYSRAIDALRSDNRAAAIILLHQAILENPRYAHAHLALATTLRDQADLSTAITHYEEALAIDPGFVDAMVNLAETLRRGGRHQEAMSWCDRAVSASPGYVDARLIRGTLHHDLGNLADAISDFSEAVAQAPTTATAYKVLGLILLTTPRRAEALPLLKTASALAPDDADIHRLIGEACHAMGLFTEGLEAYRRALDLKPRDIPTYVGLSGLLSHTRLLALALDVADIGVRLAPDSIAILFNRAVTLDRLHRTEDALLAYREVLRLEPTCAPALMFVCGAKRQLCDWKGLAEAAELTRASTYKKSVAVAPFGFLLDDLGLGDILESNQVWARSIDTGPAPLSVYAPRRPERRRDRLKIGYLSADLHNHATAMLVAELFELRDTSRFETFGYSIGGAPDDGSMRRRLMAALDNFHDVAVLSHDDAAALIRSHDIDILIDLKGFTAQARPEILARRPAPIQVNFLGYPATMGASFIDYIIGDPVVTPMAHASFYTEKIVQLPHSYQPNDRKRVIAAPGASRQDCGLTGDGFVFCCFNNVRKITPSVFDVWMRLLERVSGSVLWLFATNATAEANLRLEAAERGVDPDRLVFGRGLPVPYHLARMRHADLFLDTAPYGAHTTTSEALWAGLPVLTVQGDVFAARVGASLLTAIGLPELIARDWREYEAIALRLAESPQDLRALKARLAANLETEPLFDTGRYARDFDRALVRMAEIRDEGREPCAFSLGPVDKGWHPNASSCKTEEAAKG